MNQLQNKIFCGGNLEVVSSWPPNFISGIVTDPPYGLGFMGKEWDTLIEKTRDSVGGFLRDGKSGSNPYAAARCRHGSDSYQMQEWYYHWAKAMLRITKPGGFLLCFGGTRTYHRLACAIEDAGWEIRDCMMWLYGSGFPKSHNISKAIDKAAGAKRKQIKTPMGPTGNKYAKGLGDDRPWMQKAAKTGHHEHDSNIPATDLAKLWVGYGTALKPAWEPIIVAMKPLDGTFAHNAETHQVAGLNIDGGRIGAEQTYTIKEKGFGPNFMDDNWKPSGKEYTKTTQGRWPANLILDEEAGAMLDKQTGISKSPQKTTNYGKHKTQPGAGGTMGGGWDGEKIVQRHGDSGGASRFFYCAKTSRRERNMGMENCEDKLLARSGGAQGAENRGEKEYLQKSIGLNRVAVVKNNHPTVKPLALMKYLCTLLKMPSADQIILDPFLGSGTTGMACKELGINFIGIEKEREYCEIAVKRIAAVKGQEITLHADAPLPVTKNVETFRTTKDFAGGSRRPDENLPRISEDRQRIINAASAALKEKRK